MGAFILRPSVPFVPCIVDLPRKLLVKSSADGKWLLISPDNSVEWKAIAERSLVMEAFRLPSFSAWAYVVQESVQRALSNTFRFPQHGLPHYLDNQIHRLNTFGRLPLA